MAFRYFKRVLKGSLALTNPLIFLASFLFSVSVQCIGEEFSLVNVAVGAAWWIGIFVVVLCGSALLATLSNIKMISALEKYGYSAEYLRIFEQERMTGKPFNFQIAVNYAEILRQMGQYEEAVRYLSSITVPMNTPRGVRIMYFAVYASSALKLGDIAAAEQIWQQNMQFFNEGAKKWSECTNNYLLYLTMIEIDCCAGRIQRAYEQTIAYMNTRDYKRCPANFCEYEIMLLYELKALGRTDEFNALYPKVREKVYSKRHIFSCDDQVNIKNFNEAVNGQVPL